VDATLAEVVAFLKQWRFFEQSALLDAAGALSVGNGILRFGSVQVNANLASAVAIMLRHKLLEARASFSFETVLSLPDTVQFLKHAQESEYRTYLYYVATEDPDINISRVRSRAIVDGHPVLEDKIVIRYFLSLDLLKEAVRHSTRAYIFDNSEQLPVLVAEISDGHRLSLTSALTPRWFKKAYLDKSRSSDQMF